jgi:hypothetical protein
VINNGELGSNLLNSYKFDHLFTYDNFKEATGKNFTELLFAALPDSKERANKYSQEDVDIIENMKDILKTIKVDRIIVISTIEVYNDIDKELDEDYDCDWFINHPYGNHRYMFEYFIKFQFKNHHIIRLPHIFTYVRKSDLINEVINKNFEKSVIQMNYQFYFLDWLMCDIAVVLDKNIELCNFSTEPIGLTELMTVLKIPQEKRFDYSMKGIFCYIGSKHSNSFKDSGKNYIRNKEKILYLIENLV